MKRGHKDCPPIQRCENYANFLAKEAQKDISWLPLKTWNSYQIVASITNKYFSCYPIKTLKRNYHHVLCLFQNHTKCLWRSLITKDTFLQGTLANMVLRLVIVPTKDASVKTHSNIKSPTKSTSS